MDERLKTRKKIYRQSNIEHEYYRELINSERSFLKRKFLEIEAKKLEKFESVLEHANIILAVNDKNVDYYKIRYPKSESIYLPSFHASEKVNIKNGTGEYVLFHGNLSVSENYEAARWLIENVFTKLSVPVIIAGLKPPSFLKDMCEKYFINLIANPGEVEMNELITNAQVHVLHTEQPTGLKLKLLNVLYKGRFSVVKDYMIFGTRLKGNDSLYVAKEGVEFVQKINECMGKEISGEMLKQREEQVIVFDNRLNAEKLIQITFKD